MLLDAKKQLKEVIEGKLADAASNNDHTTVLRFVRLYAPLQLKVRDVMAMCQIHVRLRLLSCKWVITEKSMPF